MRTYSHGVIGYLLYAKRSRQERRLAMLGGMVPDMLLVTGFIPHYIERVTSSSTVAGLHHLLHFSTLHTVTICMHSFVIVGLLLAVSSIVYKPALPFWVGMLAHGIVDLLTHEQWAYNHFFPIPLAPIEAILSYTDIEFTIAEHALLVLFMTWWLIKRKSL
jgi:membrane-bound metal-dependent hydrolase YbcI (DUF457 family)